MRNIKLGVLSIFAWANMVHGDETFLQIARIEASYKELPKLTELISGESKLTLFEGLPRQAGGQKELELEETVIQKEFPFYKVPIKVSKADENLLRQICSKTESFQPFGGFKGSGGFHPDYSLHWAIGDRVAQIQVCFGRHEIRGYLDDVYVYTEISSGTLKWLSEILGRYKSQRPETK